MAHVFLNIHSMLASNQCNKNSLIQAPFILKSIPTNDLLFLLLFLFFFFLIYFLFIYGCVGSSFLCKGFLQLWQVGATLHRGARAPHYRGLSCCGAQAPDAQAQQLWLTGLVAPRHVGSSETRARTRVPRIVRQILNHCASREAPLLLFLSSHLEFLFFFIFEFYFIYLYSRFLLVIHFIHISVYMSIPVSQFITPAPPPRHFPPLVPICLYYMIHILLGI